jgi:hypothetical protein
METGLTEEIVSYSNLHILPLLLTAKLSVYGLICKQQLDKKQKSFKGNGAITTFGIPYPVNRSICSRFLFSSPTPL